MSMVDIFDIFADAGTDEVVLNPAKGAFDLAFSLRREGVDWFDLTVFDDHLPLRVDVVGKLHKVVVPLVTSSNVTEDGMAVRVIG